jgi:hypothetical protein
MIDLPFSVYIPDLAQSEQLVHSLAYSAYRLPNQQTAKPAVTAICHCLPSLLNFLHTFCALSAPALREGLSGLLSVTGGPACDRENSEKPELKATTVQ